MRIRTQTSDGTWYRDYWTQDYVYGYGTDPERNYVPEKPEKWQIEAWKREKAKRDLIKMARTLFIPKFN